MMISTKTRIYTYIHVYTRIYTYIHVYTRRKTPREKPFAEILQNEWGIRNVESQL